jgi:hypothetical protein
MTLEIMWDVKGSLIVVMYQLDMLEFLEDVDRYIQELAKAEMTNYSLRVLEVK